MTPSMSPSASTRGVVAVLIAAFVSTAYLLGAVGPGGGVGLLVGQFAAGVAKRTDVIVDGFLVSSEQCHIADVDPHHESIVKYLKPAEPIVCSRLAPLTYTSLEDGRQVVRVDTAIVLQYTPSASRLSCCYSLVARHTDSVNNVTKCVNFNKHVTLATTVDFVFIQCRDVKTKRVVYSTMHAVVQRRPPRTVVPTPATPDNSRPNILLLGIDSMSRLNLIRTMPRTVAFLQSNRWLEFRGYNKVGDNTLPNLMAVLMGRNKEQLEGINCWPRTNNSIDDCPFIWSDFKRNGYVTTYAEDELKLSTFNYHSAGFHRQPTDYYFRPFMLTARQKLPYQTRDGHTICLGPVATTEHFLKYTLDLVTTYKKALFALIWLNNFSHNNHNTPAAVDHRFLQFMEELSNSEVLNNTVVVFFSDHGARFGKIRETFVGWLEERLPFLYIWFPDSLQERFPDAYRHLQSNRDKLTSPYDLHLTLRELLGSPSNGTDGCPTCHSLMREVPHERKCDDAGIPSHWCTCALQTPTSVAEPAVRNATLYAVKDIMGKLGNATEGKCARLELNGIVSARFKTEHGKKVNEYRDYVVVFDTVPGLALFDATVRYWPQTKDSSSKYKVIGFISRINSYAVTSTCIEDKELKLYCHCLDS